MKRARSGRSEPRPDPQFCRNQERHLRAMSATPNLVRSAPILWSATELKVAEALVNRLRPGSPNGARGIVRARPAPRA